MKIEDFDRSSHSVYLLIYHIIICVKYRKKLLNVYGDEVKSIIRQLAEKENYQIQAIEVDQDHIHVMIKTKPNGNPSKIIASIKRQTTYELWKKHEYQLSKQFWKKRTFWSPSYFVCTIGTTNPETIASYINNQSKERNSTATLKRSQTSCA
jgi:putative transposase